MSANFSSLFIFIVSLETKIKKCAKVVLVVRLACAKTSNQEKYSFQPKYMWTDIDITKTLFCLFCRFKSGHYAEPTPVATLHHFADIFICDICWPLCCKLQLKCSHFLGGKTQNNSKTFPTRQIWKQLLRSFFSPCFVTGFLSACR